MRQLRAARKPRLPMAAARRVGMATSQSVLLGGPVCAVGTGATVRTQSATYTATLLSGCLLGRLWEPCAVPREHAEKMRHVFRKNVDFTCQVYNSAKSQRPRGTNSAVTSGCWLRTHRKRSTMGRGSKRCGGRVGVVEWCLVVLLLPCGLDREHTRIDVQLPCILNVVSPVVVMIR